MAGDRLTMLQAQLERLHGQVRQVLLDTLGEGKSPGANEAAPMVAEAREFALGLKLRPILHGLALVQRELDSMGHAFDLRERVAQRVPREFRFRARQSVASGRQRHGAVYQLLTEILDDLRSLWGGRGPSERELMDAAADAVSAQVEFGQKMTSSLHEFRSVLGHPDGPAVLPGGPAATLQNVPVAALATLAWLLVHMLLRRGGRPRA